MWHKQERIGGSFRKILRVLILLWHFQEKQREDQDVMANEVVKYNNKFNQVVFQNFTEKELSLIMAICSRLRGKGTDTITLTFDQIKDLTKEKQHYTAKDYAAMIDGMYQKLLNLCYVYNDGEDVAGAFHLFQGYERSITDKEVRIAITPQFQYLFNSLEREFTRFELEEFVNLSGKYPKLLYRQLKQWRTVGTYSVLLKEFRELMDVPDSYTTRDITKRIVVPSVNKLLKLREFHFLTYKYSYKGKTAIRITFNWYPEKVPSKKSGEETEKSDSLANIPEKKDSIVDTKETADFTGWKFPEIIKDNNASSEEEEPWPDDLPF